MNLYEQGPEVRLLGAFLSRLAIRSVIDVGAECGAFAEHLLAVGGMEVYMIEPEPANAEFLRRRFADESRVNVHEYAIGDSDRELALRLSVDGDGHVLTFGHTVLERPATDEIAWRESVVVTGRSLASLLAAGELPRRVGILKIDTEGNDLAVVAGMGDLEADVVMVEHWRNLPHSLGPCPWSTEQMVEALAQRGFAHFAFIEHHGEFVILKWDDGDVEDGHMGNLVFLHDRVLDRLLPDVVDCASRLATGAVAVGEMYAVAARERLELMETVDRESERRLRRIEELSNGRTPTSRLARRLRRALRG